jgi:hypothetical protein
MEVSKYGQVSYPQEANTFAPDGCIAQGNEHGGCMDRGCEWCFVYYHGPEVLAELEAARDNHESVYRGRDVKH